MEGHRHLYIIGRIGKYHLVTCETEFCFTLKQLTLDGMSCFVHGINAMTARTLPTVERFCGITIVIFLKKHAIFIEGEQHVHNIILVIKLGITINRSQPLTNQFLLVLLGCRIIIVRARGHYTSCKDTGHDNDKNCY